MARQKRDPISESEWQEIIAHYQDGTGLERLARLYGRRRETIRAGLVGRGVKIVKKPPSYKHVDWDYIKSLYESGKAIAECAKVAGCSTCHCGNMLKKLGTQMRRSIDAEAQTAKEWLQRRDISQASLARKACVRQGDVSYYLTGRIGSDAITEALRDIGCPERLLEDGNRKQVKQIEGKRVKKPGYWDPWAEGQVMCPPGVSSNEIIMCPLR